MYRGLTPVYCDVPRYTAVEHQAAVVLGVLGSLWESQAFPQLVRTVSVGQHLPTAHPVHQGKSLCPQPFHLHRPRVEPCHMTLYCDVPRYTAVEHQAAVVLGVLGSLWESQAFPQLVRTISVGQHLPTAHPVHQGKPLCPQPFHLHRPRRSEHNGRTDIWERWDKRKSLEGGERKDDDLGQKEGSAKVKMEERGHWGSKTEFLLAVAGNVVGLGNVWRFPYLCYKNGGGAFLVPYLVFVVPCGVPLFLLEMAMGQYTQEGGITCWKRLCPLAEGIGYAGQLILLYSCMCYIIILAWALFYPVSSFSAQLPWTSCTNPRNTGTYPGPAAPTPGTLAACAGNLGSIGEVGSVRINTSLSRDCALRPNVHLAHHPTLDLDCLYDHVYPHLEEPQPGRQSYAQAGGMYVFQLFDYYACNRTCLLFLSVFESLAIGWIFGEADMN
ncbi:unnamed protein product [Coregonus sp. 'balchen']|nr:unnamed protein product [Coregonus sp. 'balchen']